MQLFNHKKSKTILSVDDWTRPKDEHVHWVDGRSAKELARAWFPHGANEPKPPSGFLGLFTGVPAFSDLELTRGAPECITSLPESGGQRNHDLWVMGNAAAGSVTICVEAKADEPFDKKTIRSYYETQQAVQQKHRESGKSGKGSAVPDRIEKLLALVGGDLATWGERQYQLLTAVAGTILQAKTDGSCTAALVIHVFRTDKTDDDKIAANKRELEALLALVGLDPTKPFELQGPVQVPQTELAGPVDLYIGEVFTDLANR